MSELESLGIICLPLCNLRVLCAFVVGKRESASTTETQSTEVAQRKIIKTLPKFGIDLGSVNNLEVL